MKVSKAKIVANTSVRYDGELSLRELIALHLRALLSDPTAFCEVSVRYTNKKMCEQYIAGMVEIRTNGEPGAPRNPELVIDATSLVRVKIPGVDTMDDKSQVLREALAGDDPGLAEIAFQIAQAAPTHSTLPVEIVEPPAEEPEVEPTDEGPREVIRPKIEVDRDTPLLGTQDDDLGFLDGVGFSNAPADEAPSPGDEPDDDE